MTPEQFRKALAKGGPAAAYLFSGPETRGKRAALRALVALVPEATRDFNLQVFHAFEADLTEVLTAARTLPFMAPRRVVVLRDIEKMRLDQGGRAERLAEYAVAPAPESVLVVTTEDEERAKSLGKLVAAGLVQVEFRPLKGAALAAALREEAAQFGCRLEDAGLAALLEATGEDLGRALNELEKLRSALGEGAAIGADAVARYVAGYEHHRSFDIVDAMSRRDLAGSVRLLEEIALKDEEFLGLLGQIGKRLRVLWFLAGGGRSVPEEFRVSAYQLERLRGDGRRFTRAEIERGLGLLRAVDERVKSTAVPPRMLLEHFLISFLAGGAP